MHMQCTRHMHTPSSHKELKGAEWELKERMEALEKEMTEKMEAKMEEVCARCTKRLHQMNEVWQRRCDKWANEKKHMMEKIEALEAK